MRELDNAGRQGALVLLASVLLALAIAGCANSDKTTDSLATHPLAGSSSAGTATSSGSQNSHSGDYLKSDGDEDTDDENPAARGNDEQPLLDSYGPPSSPAEARTIAALVKRYYAASLAGNAARACSMLSADLAASLAAHNAQGTQTSCAQPMSVLLEQQHQRFVAEDVATMLVTAVHVKGNLGLSVLAFRKTPESQIILVHEGGVWRIDALFGTYMP